jgi:hypothetical protein
MPLLLAVTLAAAMQPACSWDNPGHNPYTGSTAAAIDRYTDIPEAVRRALKRRIEEGKPDDKVSITRDGIAGAQQYDPIIRGMHFGSASMCGEVTRRKWSEARVEPGVVYCAEQHCILVPKICGNVSRISRAGDRMVSLPSREARALSDEDEFADVGLVPPERGPNPHAIEHLEDMDAEDMLRLLDRAIREMLAERLAGGMSISIKTPKRSKACASPAASAPKCSTTSPPSSSRASPPANWIACATNTWSRCRAPCRPR